MDKLRVSGSGLELSSFGVTAVSLNLFQGPRLDVSTKAIPAYFEHVYDERIANQGGTDLISGFIEAELSGKT